MDVKEYKKLVKQPKKSKYKNVPQAMDGKRFHSKREAARYAALKNLQVCGEIRGLKLQTKYQFLINGELLRYPDTKTGRKGSPVTYFADFEYEQIDKKLFIWRRIVEDCKGFRTPEYKLKAALMLACHKIKVFET